MSESAKSPPLFSRAVKAAIKAGAIVARETAGINSPVRWHSSKFDKVALIIAIPASLFLIYMGTDIGILGYGVMFLAFFIGYIVLLEVVLFLANRDAQHYNDFLEQGLIAEEKPKIESQK